MVDVLEPEYSGSDPVDEHCGEQAVGRADRQQVEQDGDERDGQRPEGDQQQQAADCQDEEQDVGSGRAYGVKVVGGGRCRPAGQDLGARSGESGRDRLLAQFADRRYVLVRVRVSLDGDRQRLNAPTGRGLDRAGPEARVVGEDGLEVGEVRVCGGRLTYRDDLDGVGVLAGEVAFDGHVTLLGGKGIWQGRHPALADVQAEYRDGQQGHEPRGEGQADARVTDDPADERTPDPAFSGVAAADVLAHDRQPQRVDLVSHDTEHRGQQGQGGY